jgi:hypothetical protein
MLGSSHGVVGREPEVSLNQKVKNLIQQLGEAIHESVSESEHIAGVVRNLREQGFDVLLMLEATIGLNEVEAEDDADGGQQPLRLTAGEPEDGPFTRSDVSFLKSLRIALPEEAEGKDGHKQGKDGHKQDQSG